jgi:hypothetical protein
MAYLTAFVAGTGSAIVGFAVAAMIGMGIAAAIGLSDSYNFTFALLAVGPIGGGLGLLLGIYLVFRRRYKAPGAIAWRSLIVLAAIAALAVGGLDLARRLDVGLRMPDLLTLAK